MQPLSAFKHKILVYVSLRSDHVNGFGEAVFDVNFVSEKKLVNW